MNHQIPTHIVGECLNILKSSSLAIFYRSKDGVTASTDYISDGSGFVIVVTYWTHNRQETQSTLRVQLE